jgi:hypothetical protein
MANIPLQIKRGVTFSANITISSAGVASNLTGKTLIFHVVKKGTGKDLFALSTADAANENGSRFYFTAAQAGALKIKIADEDTLIFKLEAYTWWIELSESGDKSELAAGTFKIANP